jgi:hypothetical protein
MYYTSNNNILLLSTPDKAVHYVLGYTQSQATYFPNDWKLPGVERLLMYYLDEYTNVLLVIVETIKSTVVRYLYYLVDHFFVGAF